MLLRLGVVLALSKVSPCCHADLEASLHTLHLNVRQAGRGEATALGSFCLNLLCASEITSVTSFYLLGSSSISMWLLTWIPAADFFHPSSEHTRTHTPFRYVFLRGWVFFSAKSTTMKAPNQHVLPIRKEASEHAAYLLSRCFCFHLEHFSAPIKMLTTGKMGVAGCGEQGGCSLLCRGRKEQKGPVTSGQRGCEARLWHSTTPAAALSHSPTSLPLTSISGEGFFFFFPLPQLFLK